MPTVDPASNAAVASPDPGGGWGGGGPDGMGATRRDIGSVAAYVIAGLIGLAYAFALLGPSFLDQDSIYWQRPVGLAGGPFDLKTNLAGYFWVLRETWQWPLLWLPNVDAPAGMNAYQFDSMPGLALAAKLLRSFSLGTNNLYPAWIMAAFVLNAVALVSLVRALGQKGLLATVVAACLGILAPAVHFRYGHSALMAHFFPIFALAIYFRSRDPATWPGRHIAVLLALCFVVATNNLYMYVMTAAIAAAIFLQLAVDRRITLAACAGSFIVLLFVAFLPTWAFGALADPNLRAVTVPFGYNSMNLMAPFWPQSSGLLRWTGLYAFTRGSIGATAGQWEGYTYLGSGALLLIGVAAALRLGSLPGQLRRHWVLATALLLLTLWAISNHIYAGSVLLLAYPVPSVLENTVFAWFRASGRFFWPMGWMLTAIGIVVVVGSLRPRIALTVTAAAILLQLADVSYMANKIADMVRHPAPSRFGSQENVDRIAGEIKARGRLVVLPSFSCRPDAYSSANTDAQVATLEVEYLAARANVDVRHPKGSRPAYECEEERTKDLAQLVGNGVLVAIPFSGEGDRTAEARRELSCWQAEIAWICTASRPAAASAR